MLNVECEYLKVLPVELEHELEYTAYEKVNVQSKNLNVEREKLNDENANSDVKQQMYDKMRKVECKMKHSILAGMERHSLSYCAS